MVQNTAAYTAESLPRRYEGGRENKTKAGLVGVGHSGERKRGRKTNALSWGYIGSFIWPISSPSLMVRHLSHIPSPRVPTNEKTGFCGAMSIFTSLRYCLGDPADRSLLYIAMGFVPFGFFFDFLDGRVARWRKKSSLMGQELDSLADLVLPPIFPSPPPPPLTPLLKDLLRHGARLDSLLPRLPILPRHTNPLLLRSLRSFPSRALQRYRSNASQGCHWKE